MAPLSLVARGDRSLIFLGNLRIIQVSAFAEISSLWGGSVSGRYATRENEEDSWWSTRDGEESQSHECVHDKEISVGCLQTSSCGIRNTARHGWLDDAAELEAQEERKAHWDLRGVKEVLYPYTSADYRGIWEIFSKARRIKCLKEIKKNYAGLAWLCISKTVGQREFKACEDFSVLERQV